jgi:23S rRNA pseudouridine1911/1915/1917 synthase
LEENDTFFISEDEQGERLDKILAARLHAFGSRTYFQFLIEEKRVFLNGKAVKKRVIPQAGDEVEVHYVAHPELSLKPENLPLNLIFEDESLLVVNKPAGMVVHPALGHWSGTFVNALLFHCREGIWDDSLRPGVVHRLDKDTTGLLLAAKRVDVQQKLMELFAARAVQKEYLAICIGNPGEGTIAAPIGRHPVQRKQMAVVESGREALTHYRSLCCSEKLSLVQLRIVTGRTHQIRVHMQHNKTAVLGDELYGNAQLNAKFGAERQMLHAHTLQFVHPVTGQLLRFEAPLPSDMLKILIQNKLKITPYAPGALFRLSQSPGIELVKKGAIFP